MGSKSLKAFKGADGTGAELLRDNILRRGGVAAIIYRNGDTDTDGELYAIQTATALAAGKPFGGFIPARPIKTLIVGHRRDAAELGALCDALFDFWKSAGWTDEEVEQGLHDTRIIDSRGKTGNALVEEVQAIQDETPLDLIVVCNLVGCYGDDPEHPSSQSLAHFLQAGLGRIQSGAHPCAILGIVGIEDGDDAIRNFLDGTTEEDPDPQGASKIFSSTIGSAIARWAKSIFAIGIAYAQSGASIRIVASVRTDGRLLWCCPAYGEGCSGHALRFRDGHFEEVNLKNLSSQKRRTLVSENYSCADTLEAEIEL